MEELQARKRRLARGLRHLFVGRARLRDNAPVCGIDLHFGKPLADVDDERVEPFIGDEQIAAAPEHMPGNLRLFCAGQCRRDVGHASRLEKKRRRASHPEACVRAHGLAKQEGAVLQRGVQLAGKFVPRPRAHSRHPSSAAAFL